MTVGGKGDDKSLKEGVLIYFLAIDSFEILIKPTEPLS
jgi:hypothetical protein